MKKMTSEELIIRLRRTVINKYSSTIRPKYRKRLRELAFDNKQFCDLTDKIVGTLIVLEDEVVKEIIKKEEEMQKAIKAKKEQK